MLDIIIMLIRSINVWVNASCFFNSCIRVLMLVVQFSGFRGGKEAGSACGMGGFGIALSEWGLAVWTLCWECGGIGGGWWRGFCLSGWVVRASGAIHVSSGADLVNLCSRLVSVRGGVGWNKVGRR